MLLVVKVIIHYFCNTSSPWIRRYWDGMESKRSVLYSHTNENLHSLPVLFLVLEAVVLDVELYDSAATVVDTGSEFFIEPHPLWSCTKTAEPKSFYRRMFTFII